MASGFKTGGRKKGTPNIRTTAIRERLDKLMRSSGYDPFQALIEVAQSSELDLETRIQIHKHLLKFVYPELAPVTSPEGENIESQSIRVIVA